MTERRRVEEELQRHKAHLDELFELSPDAIVLTDLSHPWIIRVNREFTRMFGYASDEAVGKRLRHLIVPDGVAPADLSTNPELLAGRKVETEVVRRRKDGTLFDAQVTAARVRLQDDADAAYLIYRDISERKRAQALLAGENRVLEMIAKGSPLAATLDALCRLMEEIFAGCLASIIVIDAQGRMRHGAAPSLPESYTSVFDGAACGPRSGPCGVAVHSRQPVVVSDIDSYPYDDNYRMTAAAHGLRSCWSTPVFSSDDKVLGTFAIFFREPRSPSAEERQTIERLSHLVSIVIERTEAVNALLRSEQRYALAMDATGDGHWDWNIASDTFYVSPLLLEMCGLPADTPITTRAEFMQRFPFHPDDRHKWETTTAAHLAGQTARFNLEMRILPRGHLRWIQLTGLCSRDTAGAPLRWAGSVTDITERKRAEAALLESERQRRQAQRLEAMGTLAGGIAHDFNNILGAILGYGEMALRDTSDTTRLRRDLDSIISAGERGRALVDRILAFSRSGVGERVPVHVERVVHEGLNLLSAKLPRNIQIEAKLDAGRAAMMGDATQVHQVLMNLAMNAAQAMAGGGTLRVSLSNERLDSPRAATIGSLAAADYVVLRVADGGTGISPDALDRIFDPFFTTKDVGVGTGLGLSLVHGIVIQLGGSIDVASTPGSGAVFTVYFPHAGEAPTDEREPETAQIPRGDGEHILVVDDEEALVALAKRTLDELGYTAAGYTSGPDALKAFQAEPQRFDAIVTDERMPGMSGSALIREVRTIRRSIPILLVTGFASSAVANRAYSSGATEVLKKPLSRAELAASLARVLHPQ